MKKILNIIILSLSLVIFVSGFFKYNTNKLNLDNDLTTVKLAEVTHSVFYTPLYIAIENGYFKDEGINLDLILTPGADAVSAAVISGDVHIGLAGAESVMYIYEAGQEDYLQIFSGLTKRDGQFIVSREKIENFTMNDLIGKEILIGRSSGMPALNFINSINNYGIYDKDIITNSSIEFAALSGAFISGEGDFVNLFEPNATLIEKEGYGYIVASVGELSGEVPYTAFYSSKSYIENNDKLLQGFTNAISKALLYIQETDVNIIAKDIINQFPDQNIEELSYMIDNYIKYDCWLTTPIIEEELFYNLETFLINFNLLETKSSYDNLVVDIYK